MADARAAIDANAGVKGVYATGIIAKVDDFTDGAITYWISADGTTEGDMNIKYYVQLKTTTNLPITVKLYRNQEYSSSATNIAQGYELVQDEDGAWYKLYTQSPYYEFQYNVRTQDTYVLVVDYPEVYKSYLEYTGVPENIEVAIYSEQKS